MLRALMWMALVAACGERANPNVCCVTEAQCEDLGANELRPCGMGQACSADHTCIAAECSDNGDCSDEAPVCRLGFCESTCGGDEDCADVAGRTHCLEGACVGCTMNDECAGTMAICDAEDHTCRGCERDDECASGVCLEIDAACADGTRVLYVGDNGSASSGECERSMPCRFDYALTKIRANRDVIHFVTGAISLPSTTLSVSYQLTLDGAPTMLTASATATPTFSIANAFVLTLENIVLTPASIAADLGTIRMFGVQARGLRLSVAGGTLAVAASDVAGAIECTGSGTFSLRTTTFTDSEFVSTGCSGTVARNRFQGPTDALTVTGGTVTVENNVFVTTDELVDIIYMIGGVGSVFRFNTLVNQSATIDSGVALYCDASTTITSNIFAYNSTNPISGNGACTITSSLFDQQGASDAGPNTVGDHNSFFVDLAGGDFHLAPSSPAIGGGEAGLVEVDLDGKSRSGTAPAIGAYEAE